MNEHINYAIQAVKDAGFEIARHELVGSTYIADKQDSDLDVLILVKKPSQVLEDKEGLDLLQHVPDLESAHLPGWKYGGSYNEGDPGVWESFKTTWNGREINAILVDNEEYWWSWVKAAEVCRYIHLMQKKNGDSVYSPEAISELDVRIGIHNILMDDSSAEDEAKVR
jgi:hypothetical protein